jgi:Kef-type K+ transport system membrane component KefB
MGVPITVNLPTSGAIGSGGSLGAGATTQIGSIIGGTIQVIGSVGMAMAVGTVAAMVANWAFGLSGDAALVTTLAGAGTGLAVGVGASIISASLGMGWGGCLASGLFAAICAAVVVIVVVITALIMKLLGIGDIKEVHVKYNCLPWQAPSGASNCLYVIKTR